jgi:signal peptidase I
MTEQHPVTRHSLPRRLIESFTGPWTWRNFFGWAGIIILILFIKGCLIDQYTIPTGSMEPTLRGDPRFFRGDRVLVNKWIFGPRIPFTTKRLWKWAEPKRWDIVVFRSIDPEAEHPILIKRVIGLPGERVHINDGNIYINNELATPPEYLRDRLHYVSSLEFTTIERKRQFLKLAQMNKPLPILNSEHPPVKLLYQAMEQMHPQVVSTEIDSLKDEEVENLCKDLDKKIIHLMGNIFDFVQPDMSYGISEEDKYSLVPENHVFLLGDNSAQSLDGRMYGWVPQNHLYGRTFAVWWPWGHRQDFTGFSTTWWGKMLLYGIPALIILMEVRAAVKTRKVVKS